METYNKTLQTVYVTSLTHSEALTRALLENPYLRAFAWEVRAREAHALQAGLRPNPEMGTDLEDFAGTGPLSRFEATEITFGLSQVIELGGDRRRRQQVASVERDLAGWDYETVRLDVLTETTQAFTRVLAAQQRHTLADSLLTQAERFYQSVLARVEAGKVSALEERRAQVVRSTTQIAFERATRDVSIARSQLAATWGQSEPDFEQVVGNLAYVAAVPGYDRGKVSLTSWPCWMHNAHSLRQQTSTSMPWRPITSLDPRSNDSSARLFQTF
jgi:cobalt-zinc-cadmium efflux system outer membrane protein